MKNVFISFLTIIAAIQFSSCTKGNDVEMRNIESSILLNRCHNDSIIRIYQNEIDYEQLGLIIYETNEDPNDTAELVSFMTDIAYKVDEYMRANYEIDVWEDEVSSDDPMAIRAVALSGLAWIAIESEFEIENWPEDDPEFSGTSQLETCLYRTISEIIGIELVKEMITQYRLGMSLKLLFKSVKFAVRKVAFFLEAASAILSFSLCMLEE